LIDILVGRNELTKDVVDGRAGDGMGWEVDRVDLYGEFRARGWLAGGTNITAGGAGGASSRELDGATVAACSLFVDRRESTINESGEYRSAIAEGAITPEHIVGELGDVITGRLRGRKSDEEITLFKSLGLAVEDLASAAWLYERATALGAGSWVEL
jgi:ornithine cyclodeaminase/alanine dehydrogenase-like protein (mu-crystallin family)